MSDSDLPDDLELHLHFHGHERRRKLAVHIHYHGGEASDRGSRAKPSVGAMAARSLAGSHFVTTPQTGISTPARRADSSTGIICAQGTVLDADFMNGKVFAAVRRTLAELGSAPPSGAPFGVIDPVTAFYEIPALDNVLFGSSSANWIGLWPTTPSGRIGHIMKLAFTAHDAGATFCEGLPPPAAVASKTALAAPPAKAYLARAVGVDDPDAKWLAEPIELQRAPSAGKGDEKLWCSANGVALELRIIESPCCLEAELALLGFGGRKLDAPLVWRADHFLCDEANMFYLAAKDDRAQRPVAILVEPR